jgi:hypothetical protein
MGGSFATSDDDANVDAQPLRAPQRREDVWTEARNLASELPRWRVLEADEARGILVCECAGGLLAPASRVTLTFEGPEGIPSTTVNARSESTGGLLGLSRDRARVLEFMRLLRRRVE